ncbi:hydrogenase 4 subunit B [Methylococcus geothermalis]|uniref:Hydrogenase 4 subunit B n=1 Tax=Methylococcus geothermalis TaxID=2681310 RepID=A0A858QAG8_9GAMM|nr:hydrogenase 4 subunit B [Methylococcus geothermalis]QJD30676.1 hydrogenase 4 subunit B [Methylococcus geothermalis]
MTLFLAYASVLAALFSGLLAMLAEHRAAWARQTRRAAGLIRTPFPASLALTESHPQRLPHAWRRWVFALLTASGVLALAAGGLQLHAGTAVADQLPWGLPWLQWHVRFDTLSAFFFVVLGLGVIAAGVYGPGYARQFAGQYSFGALGLFTGLFVAGMEGVLLADDAYVFVIAWEVMTVSSYFLVAYQHEHASHRRAAFLYLLMGEVGAIAIILAFGILAAVSHSFAFDVWRDTHVTPSWGTGAFLLALAGFGMKAGLVPLHAWLPEAHPAAPAHISGLMSGVMLKIAVYGLLRFAFDLLGDVQWYWGAIVLGLGTGSAVLGILYAVVQSDVKRLLAYSSIENLGIVFMGMGLAMVFIGKGHGQLGLVGLVAALYHVLNHSLFKNLLFLTAGSVVHQTHQHDLEHMGGLIKRMPVTAGLFLMGSVAIAGLPPLNGFVSEWLTFQAALQAASVIDNGILRSMVSVAAAILAFTAAVAAACFVKLYGVAFLGQPRERQAAHAREVAHSGMLWAPGFLAGLCLLLGVLPTWVLDALRPVTRPLLGETLSSASARGWLWLTPGGVSTASYSAPLVLLAMAMAWWFLRRLEHGDRGAAVRRAPAWDCGFGGLSPRMQYTAAAFVQPVRRIFAPVWDAVETSAPETAPADRPQITALRYRLEIGDRSWRWLYLPMARVVEELARQTARIQTGQMRIYIAYSFVTLIILLGVVS